MSKIHWSPQEKMIRDVLFDREWHCVYNELKIKDDRARISKMIRKLAPVGYTIKSAKCDGRGNHIHSSPILMRKIEKIGKHSSMVEQPTYIRPVESSSLSASTKYAQELVRRFDNNEPVFT